MEARARRVWKSTVNGARPVPAGGSGSSLMRRPVRGGGVQRPGDVPDEDLEVRAVDGGPAEALAGPVAVRVVAAAAHLDEFAGAAARRERVPSELAGGEPGMVEEFVEAVAVDVESGGGGALVGRLQGVGLFDGAVRLDHGGGRGREPEGLGGLGQAEEQGDDLLEDPDAGPSCPVVPPAFEDGEQPVGVRGGVRGVSRRRVVPVGQGQQQAEGGRREAEQRGVHLQRVLRDVDDAQHPGVALRVSGEQPQPPGGGGEAGAAGVVHPAGVVRGQSAVEADADADAGGGERGERPRVSRVPLVCTVAVTRTREPVAARTASTGAASSSEAPSRGSPPCRTRSTRVRSWAAACSAIRSAARWAVAGVMSAGRPRQL